MKHLLNILEQNFEQRRQNKAISFIYKKNLVHESWEQVVKKSLLAAKILSEKCNHSQLPVLIISQTKRELVYLELALLKLGIPVVPVTPSISNADLEFILKDSSPQIIICEHEVAANRQPILKLELKPVVITFEQLNFDRSIDMVNAQDFFANSEIWAENTVTTIIYTSGTTGLPKGAVYSQKQILSCISNVFREFSVGPNDTTLTFLPFSHVLGRIELWGSIYYGFALGFATNPESLKNEFKIIKPTVMIGVPRIFEKIYFGILSQINMQKVSRYLFHKSMNQSLKAKQLSISKKPPSLWNSLIHGITRTSILSNVIKRLGGRLRFVVCGGAPISTEIVNFFSACGIPLYQGYGLTETTGPITVNTPFNQKPGSVGKPIKGIQLRIAQDGEILIRGEQVIDFYKNSELNPLPINDQQFYLSGDIGKIDDEGYLFITDRKKDLIKTSGGKFVAPQKLEGFLKAEPLISHVLVIGDEKKYIVALITVDRAEYEKFCQLTDMADSLPPSQNRLLIEKIRLRVSELNSELSHHETIKNYRILDNDFSTETGELTNSLKIKRSFCSAKYKDIIDSLY